MNFRAQAIHRALLSRWALALAGAETWARKFIPGRREEDFLRGYKEGYWRAAQDIAGLDPPTEIESRPKLPH